MHRLIWRGSIKWYKLETLPGLHECRPGNFTSVWHNSELGATKSNTQQMTPCFFACFCLHRTVLQYLFFFIKFIEIYQCVLIFLMYKSKLGLMVKEMSLQKLQNCVSHSGLGLTTSTNHNHPSDLAVNSKAIYHLLC